MSACSPGPGTRVELVVRTGQIFDWRVIGDVVCGVVTDRGTGVAVVTGLPPQLGLPPECRLVTQDSWPVVPGHPSSCPALCCLPDCVSDAVHCCSVPPDCVSDAVHCCSVDAAGCGPEDVSEMIVDVCPVLLKILSDQLVWKQQVLVPVATTTHSHQQHSTYHLHCSNSLLTTHSHQQHSTHHLHCSNSLLFLVLQTTTFGAVF